MSDRPRAFELRGYVGCDTGLDWLSRSCRPRFRERPRNPHENRRYSSGTNGSARLPGKTLSEVSGALITRIIQRMQSFGRLEEIVLASPDTVEISHCRRPARTRAPYLSLVRKRTFWTDCIKRQNPARPMRLCILAETSSAITTSTRALDLLEAGEAEFPEPRSNDLSAGRGISMP